jgi:ComF family protein
VNGSCSVDANSAEVKSGDADDGAASGNDKPAWRARLAGLGRMALDTILPPLCLSCQARICDHNALCPSCWRQIDFIRQPLCDRLGLPMPYDTGGPIISAAAAADPPIYDRARAVARFDGLMRNLIHNLKFSDCHDARRLFGRWLAESGRDILSECDVIVPVPLARGRLLARRFNQAQILAAEAAKDAGKPLRPFALVRLRSTAHQVGLSRSERKRNVSGAFRVPPAAIPSISGKAVVLVDDVITTGATVSAAAAALKKAGARRVDVLALALVCDP